jgi:predicted transcriptional regulator
MGKDSNEVERKLDILIGLSRHLLALELFKSGVTQEAIAKHLHIAKATVVEMLKGIKKEK